METTVLHSAHHLAYEQLADLADGRLDPGDQDSAQLHLAGCERCHAEFTLLQRVTGVMRADALEDPPAHVVARALRIIQQQPDTASRQPNLLRRIQAVLTFDSIQTAPAFGVRSATTGIRQLLFSAGDRDLDLRLEHAGAGWQISGQILGACDGGGQIALLGGPTPIDARLSELCEFTLPPVPAGNYSLTVRLSDVEFTAPVLELGG